MNISVFDLTKQYRSIEKEIDPAIKRVIEKGKFILGPEVSMLEEEIASYIGVDFGVGVANGTDALHLALLACGIGAGDEVITTPFTFIATCEAISYCGAHPVFVDIDTRTYTIDADRIEEKITEHTKAIIPVHLYGQSAEMDKIMDIAGRYGLRVIEDAAQAFGADYKGRKAGGIGDAGCLSFFPTKNLGGYGDGGMVLTRDKDIAAKVRMLRVHGSSKKYIHKFLGFNSRLDELQAAILRVKLKYIDPWNEMRRENAAHYNRLLKGYDIIPYEEDHNRHVYHLYVICINDRDECQSYLSERGISTAIHYSIPVSKQDTFKHLGYKEEALPNSHRISREILALPMYPELTEGEITVVCSNLKDFLKEARP
ncbi:MAG: DegT/DnrJ/EryC1/StrS family aminotransferase [Nitrospinota bacterium]